MSMKILFVLACLIACAVSQAPVLSVFCNANCGAPANNSMTIDTVDTCITNQQGPCSLSGSQFDYYFQVNSTSVLQIVYAGNTNCLPAAQIFNATIPCGGCVDTGSGFSISATCATAAPTSAPTSAPTTTAPTAAPTTKAPTSAPTTAAPTAAPTGTAGPTTPAAPTTVAPTLAPSTFWVSSFANNNCSGPAVGWEAFTANRGCIKLGNSSSQNFNCVPGSVKAACVDQTCGTCNFDIAAPQKICIPGVPPGSGYHGDCGVVPADFDTNVEKLINVRFTDAGCSSNSAVYQVSYELPFCTPQGSSGKYQMRSCYNSTHYMSSSNCAFSNCTVNCTTSFSPLLTCENQQDGTSRYFDCGKTANYGPTTAPPPTTPKGTATSNPTTKSSSSTVQVFVSLVLLSLISLL